MICGLTPIDEILSCFLDQGARHVVLCLGEKGSVVAWSENGCVKQLKVRAFEVPVVDSTGCGDGYNAGFIKGLSLNGTWSSLHGSARLVAAWSFRALGRMLESKISTERSISREPRRSRVNPWRTEEKLFEFHGQISKIEPLGPL